jgi:hypothetical protein
MTIPVLPVSSHHPVCVRKGGQRVLDSMQIRLSSRGLHIFTQEIE